MFRAYSSRAFKKKKNDNREIVRKIISLRREKANLLSYDNYAEFVLGDRMLDSPGRVMDFLEELHAASAECDRFSKVSFPSGDARGVLNPGNTGNPFPLGSIHALSR